jgi:cystathionine beta-lyase
MVGTAVSNARCWDQLRENAYLMGQMVDADTAYMTSRGLRTLGVRLRQHHESSLKIAEWLAQHPQVARVNHPGCRAAKAMSSGTRLYRQQRSVLVCAQKRLTDAELAAIWITSACSAWPTPGAALNR